MTEDSLKHSFYHCRNNKEAGQTVIKFVMYFNVGLKEEDCLGLNLDTDQQFDLPAVIIVAVGLSLIWGRRLERKRTEHADIRSELEFRVSLLRKTRDKTLLSASDLIESSIICML